jgi:RNA polymerase sigma factor (sigma-70 family)
MIRLDTADIEAARAGDRAALEAVVRAAERPIYNLAIRMLAHRADAEDATQEILIRVITHLGSLREVEAAGGWALRIACRYLVAERKRSRIESLRLTFKGFASELEQGLAPLDRDTLSASDTALAIDEVKTGCTLAMLTCLTRDARAAYLLGDVFELTDTEAASALEIAPASYRQRLRRARVAVERFTSAHCGVASAKAACSCQERVGAAMACGRVALGRSEFGLEPLARIDVATLRSTIGGLEGVRRSVALMRSNPDFASQVGDLVLRLVKPGQVPA